MRLSAQPHLDGGQRAHHANPGLGDYYGDSRQVRKPEPQCIHPLPGSQIADEDEDQSPDDEHDDGEMQRQYHIGEQLIRHHFNPSFLPAESRLMASSSRFIFVSSFFAYSIQPRY